MEKAIIVSNTTPLSELSKVKKLDLLKDLFDRVIIPCAVYNEVIAGAHPASQEVPLVSWIEVKAVRETQKVLDLRSITRLGLGECESMILAEELGAKRLLLDDLPARKVAQSRHLSVLGTVGLLILAKEQGLIANVKEILDDVIANGKRISEALYQQVLKKAGE